MVQKNPQDVISKMKKNLGSEFKETGKTILQDGKVLKGRDAEKNFNTELNTLTFEIEELYPLNYDEFQEQFPRTLEFINEINGSAVIKAVDEGLVLSALSVRSNVDTIIENIRNNVEDPEKQKEAISLREDIYNEMNRMKVDYNIDWGTDLFWKCWKIKEGHKRFAQLIEQKGESLAEKRIDNIEKNGGLEFLELLKNEIYSEE